MMETKAQPLNKDQNELIDLIETVLNVLEQTSPGIDYDMLLLGGNDAKVYASMQNTDSFIHINERKIFIGPSDSTMNYFTSSQSDIQPVEF